MNRLTVRGEHGVFMAEGFDFHIDPDDYDLVQKILDRLAAYEETGLTPEKIKEFALLTGRVIECGAIEQAIELLAAKLEGRLVVLPAAKVFALEWDVGPNCDLICPVTIDGRGQCHFCDHGKLVVSERQCRQEDIDQIGKTVFLTREEAEAALEKEET